MTSFKTFCHVKHTGYEIIFVAYQDCLSIISVTQGNSSNTIGGNKGPSTNVNSGPLYKDCRVIEIKYFVRNYFMKTTRKTLQIIQFFTSYRRCYIAFNIFSLILIRASAIISYRHLW